MSTKNKFPMLLTMIAFVFMMSAIYTVPAYADGETPPVEPPVATQPAEPPAQDSVTTDATPAPIQDVVTDPTPSQPAPVATDSSVLADVPQGTDVVVVNDQGETVPLASKQAATAIVTGDPIWCPAGVATPAVNTNGCSGSYSTFAALLADPIFSGGGPAKDGTIWVEGSYIGGYNGNDNSVITFNGATTLSSMANFKLTLKGGWNGSGTNTIAPLTPSIFDVPLIITGWNNDVTLSDITFTAANGANSLEVSTTKNITLTNVKANSNTTGRGAYLHNDVVSGIGNVTVTNSQFNGNHTDGLVISSNGTITLKDITANLNTNGYGAQVDNHVLLVSKAVTLSGTNTFNNNGTSTGNSGLYINSFGQITLNNIAASNNGTGANGYGAQLNNDYALSIGGVTLTGTNIFNDNSSNGLYITSRGAIKLSNIFANSNNNLGAQLSNSNAVTAQAITLTGTNEFKYNLSIGLSVTSKGQITINNITANSNAGVGVALTNSGAFASGVTLTGTNFFNNNKFSGLNITTNGAVTANNINANSNGIIGGSGNGVSITNNSLINFKGVTLSGNNYFTGNKNDGLNIVSSGVILLNNITANDTITGGGAFIDNSSSGPGVPKSVTLTGSNTFNANLSTGLNINSTGAVILNNITANGNQSDGADVNNAGSTLPQAVTLNGTNSFSNNGFEGLSLNSKGAIHTNAITASNNSGSYGVYLSNSGGTSASGVTMTGINIFNNNLLDNLQINSAGAIVLSNISANGSTTGMGANIINTFATSSPVTLTGINTFNDNNNIGLKISSKGLITVSNLTANHNAAGGGNRGVWLINVSSPTKAGVTITGFGTFNNNFGSGTGLDVLSLGPVTTINLTANSNTSYGVSIDTSTPGSVGGVTLNGVNSFSGNTNSNLYINAFGAIVLNSITSAGSTGGSGANINNKQPTYNELTPKPVTLIGSNVFSNNNSDGLSITSYGAVITSAITASNNQQYGVSIDNINPSFPTPVVLAATVTINGTNILNGNTLDDLFITSQGQITTNNITANDSVNGFGTDLTNTAGTTAGITMNGLNTFNSDRAGGLNVSTNGIILAGNINATNSDSGIGAQFNNTGSTALHPKAITLSGSNVFSSNSSTGLQISTFGVITINNLTASDNGIGAVSGKGADLDNFTGATSAANVVLTGTNFFNNNYEQGLLIKTLGAINLSNITANGSTTTHGVELDNQNAPTNAFGITFTGTNTFNDNHNKGLFINSKGAVILNNVTATGSTNDFGVYINNSMAGAATAKPITFTGANLFSGNNMGGLVVTSYGTVTLSNVTASNSTTGFGVAIDNTGGTPHANVILTGSSAFNNNSGGNGLLIVSDGSVTLSNVTANGNSFSGVYVDNSTGTAGVTLTGVNTFDGNGNNGATILSHGTVSLTKVTGDLNGQSGLVVTTTGAVTLTCGDFNKNALYGWEVHNAPTITMIGVFSSLNNTSGPSIITGGGILLTTRNCPLP